VSSNGNGTGLNQNGIVREHPSPTSHTTVSNAERLNSAHQNISTERLAGYGDQGSSNSKLSEAGREYGVELGRYLKVNYQMSGHARPKSAPLEGDLGSELMVLTGTSSVHTETVSHLRMLFRCYNTPLLNELRGGDLQGMVGAHRKHLTFDRCIFCVSELPYLHLDTSYQQYAFNIDLFIVAILFQPPSKSCPL
jgi:hypothetical protein